MFLISILGARISKRMEEPDSSSSDEEIDIDNVITSLYNQGLEYKEILCMISQIHGVKMGRTSLYYHLKRLGLSRRFRDNSNDLDTVKLKINSIISGPGSLAGYRSVWHTLQIQGIRVPQKFVREVIKEQDEVGVNLRASRRLKRRTYLNPGPNYAWHIDGYDKLKPFGFAVHGAIDGYSRKILWLELMRSNNNPDNIANIYLNCVKENGGCPKKLITDLGTENLLAASLQCFLREDDLAHRFVPSPRNQRIEGWWSFFSRTRASWWRNFFKDLEENGTIDLSHEESKECLWFCFSNILKRDIDHVKEHWNSHRIRSSRFETVPGRPNVLYNSPQLSNGEENLILPVSNEEIDHAFDSISIEEEDNVVQEYFSYVKNELAIPNPSTWEEALELYRRFYQIILNQ